MWNFEPNDLWTSLIFCFHLVKNCCRFASNACRSKLLVYHRVLSGLKNSDFDVRKEERGNSSNMFELQALLQVDDAQTLIPGERVNTERYRQQMMNLNKVSCVKNDQNFKRRNTKS